MAGDYPLAPRSTHARSTKIQDFFAHEAPLAAWSRTQRLMIGDALPFGACIGKVGMQVRPEAQRVLPFRLGEHKWFLRRTGHIGRCRVSRTFKSSTWTRQDLWITIGQGLGISRSTSSCIAMILCIQAGTYEGAVHNSRAFGAIPVQAGSATVAEILSRCVQMPIRERCMH